MDAKKLKAAVKEVSAGEARGRGSSWSALIDRQLSVSGRFTAEGAAGSRRHASGPTGRREMCAARRRRSGRRAHGQQPRCVSRDMQLQLCGVAPPQQTCGVLVPLLPRRGRSGVAHVPTGTCARREGNPRHRGAPRRGGASTH